MRPLRRLSAWLPAGAGFFLIAWAAQSGGVALVLAAVPGALLLAGGVRSLLVPDLRSTQHIAAGAVLGVASALPLALFASASLGLAALCLSLVSFVAGGWLALELEPACEEVPRPEPAIGYAARVALDDGLLSIMTIASATPTADEMIAAGRESQQAQELFTARGWTQKPESFHTPPPALTQVESQPVSVRGIDCEHLRFESGYDPDPEIPGRERWLAHAANRTAHVWLARSADPAPWLICVHGFGMGKPEQDLPAFRTAALRARGLNVALIALPVHGPRAPGRRSGSEFMKTSPVDFVHAEAQAIWDLRRLLGWIRSQGAERVGLLGYSLGGYTSSLLAGLEPGLACVIAGIPPSDFIATGERFVTSLDLEIATAAGIDFARDREVHRVVSPLAVAPQVEPAGRFIFAATGDRLVPVKQVHALWRHWERPRIVWCTGGHMSSLLQRDAKALMDEALAARLLGGARSEG